jgi:predicted RNA polymerase sigma factor
MKSGPDGSLTPMAEQDRSRWDRSATEEGIALVTAALPPAPSGRTSSRQLSPPSTMRRRAPSDRLAPDRRPYDVLLRLDDNPVVALNHAVAISMVAGPRAGLELVQRLGTDPRVNADRGFCAVRGHLLVRAGHPAAALEALGSGSGIRGSRSPAPSPPRSSSNSITTLSQRGDQVPGTGC